MKKKIKDLNDYEIDIICKNNKCDNCPLNPDIMVLWCKPSELDKYGVQIIGYSAIDKQSKEEMQKDLEILKGVE